MLEQVCGKLFTPDLRLRGQRYFLTKFSLGKKLTSASCMETSNHVGNSIVENLRRNNIIFMAIHTV